MRLAATLAVTTLIAISASVGPRAFAQGFGGGPSKEPSGKALGAGRDDGRRARRQELESAAHVVGTTEPRRRLEHRRHAQHPVEPARGLSAPATR